MIPPLASICLSRGPARRVILRAGKHAGIDQLFQKLSGAGRIFHTMDEARDAIRRHRPETCGHLDDKLIGSNFSTYSTIRMSDYPVLFWLLTILRTEKLDLFDFGGGVGQTFVNFSRYLPAERLARWTVQDLPAVVSGAAEKFFPHGLPHGLEFTSEMTSTPACNVALAAGAFHYWEGSIADFFDAMGTKPGHFIINRSPMSAEGETFYTVQQGIDWAVPCQVWSMEQVKSEMRAEGYTLRDSWSDLEKALIFPLLPAYSCPYRGLYFQRDLH